MSRLITALSRDELTTLQIDLEKIYQNYILQNLNLDMSRGKPSPQQLNLCNSMLSMSLEHETNIDFDVRNYGVLDGLPAC